MMIVDRQNLPPVAHLPESFQLLPRQGKQNVTYEFRWREKDWVLKQLRQKSSDYDALGDDPSEAAATLNRFYRIVKRHFGERVVDTWYLVAKDQSGKPTVVSIQPKVEGETLLENEKVGEFEKIWTKVLKDQDWVSFSPKARKYLQDHDIKQENIVSVSKPEGQQYILVDF